MKICRKGLIPPKTTSTLIPPLFPTDTSRVVDSAPSTEQLAKVLDELLVAAGGIGADMVEGERALALVSDVIEQERPTGIAAPSSSSTVAPDEVVVKLEPPTSPARFKRLFDCISIDGIVDLDPSPQKEQCVRADFDDEDDIFAKTNEDVP